MSIQSEEIILPVASDSFWEPGNYRRTTRRIEDSFKFCSDLQYLLNERAEIEKSYSKSLQSWAKKWADLIEKGPEYGTMADAWKGISDEAECASRIHTKIQENLCDNEIQQIKNWQRENYQKAMFQLKERKEMEEQFKKAQKPWIKRLQKVEEAKANYHKAFKNEKITSVDERVASVDTSKSQDQVKRIQDRARKAKDELPKCREKYENALQEVNQYNPTYVAEMSSVFAKCQAMEETRMEFFKQILFSINKTLNVTQYEDIMQVHEDIHNNINSVDHQKDLEWWSNNHGINMGMNWPSFNICESEDDNDTTTSPDV